jgi:hypothetical protein
MNTKHHVAMREVITKYHPMFLQDKSLQKAALNYSTAFNVELLMEETLGIVGNLGHNTKGYGFDYELDKSDCKFVSLQNHHSKGSRICINGIQTSSGVKKQGSLRVVIFNDKENCLMYYFIPKSFWENKINIDGASNQGRVIINYHITSKQFKKIEQFRCKSFEELANKRDEN